MASCSILWVLVFILNLRQYVLGHSCGHTIPKFTEVIHNVHIEPAHVMRRRSINQKLRIHIEYDRSVSRLPDDKVKLVQDQMIPEAVSYWTATLQVRHTSGPIRLLRQCNTDEVRYKDDDPYPYCVRGCREHTTCGETTVPAQHLEACWVAYRGQPFRIQGYAGAGVDEADFILYVSAHSTDRCDVGTTVAYAAYCQLEGSLDRPVAGYVNLCPDSISTRPHDIHQMVSTIKHEILHALGFSAGLYAFFRDPSGQPLTPRSKATGKPAFNSKQQLHQWSERVARTFVRPDWKVRNGTVKKTVTMIVTPNVVREVRDHFNCSTLEGAELEDQGVIGTALTHWEKRVFENEVMTGTYTQNPLISRITLALMEDTGWYKVNYENAEPLTWGSGLGCDFVKNSCLHWMDTRIQRGEHIHPYCNRVKREGLQTECTDNREAVALCNLRPYIEDLPNHYQHFHEIPGVIPEHVGRYGGSVVLADYCPYIQAFTWKKGDDVVRGSRCNIHQNNADPEINYLLEQYGNRSACFEHVSAWKLRHCQVEHDIDHWGSGCYQYECSEETGLSVIVGGKKLQCYHGNQELSVSVLTEEWLHVGSIVCPPCYEVCKKDGFKCLPVITEPQRLTQDDSPPLCSMATNMTMVSMVIFFVALATLDAVVSVIH